MNKSELFTMITFYAALAILSILYVFSINTKI